MDALKGMAGMGGDSNKPAEGTGEQKEGGGGGFLGGLGDKLNSAAGGGKESEKNEDYLDKGIFAPSQCIPPPPPPSSDHRPSPADGMSPSSPTP